jgi:tripartite-type tricarboxylate transporter receptor subunit TctC
MCRAPWRAALIAAIALLYAAPALAQPRAFYAGKTISLYIGSSVGGGYDLHGRLLARHIGRHIPGNPTVVPQNMDGAGSLRLANWLYGVAPKDGTVFAILNRGVAFVPLLGERQLARFDPRRFHWLGSANDEVGVCVAVARTGIRDLAQLKERELLVGNTGEGADGTFMATMVRELLGARVRAIRGYPGGSEIYLAMERGEVDGMCGLAWSTIKTTRPQWVQQRWVNVLLQLGLRKHPDLPDVPFVMDLARNAEERALLRLILLRGAFGRPYVAPPGTPPDRVALLRAAFTATMADPRFLAEAERMRAEISPVPAATLNALIAEAYAAPPARIARAREVLN